LTLAGTIRGLNSNRFGSRGSIVAATQCVLRLPNRLDAGGLGEHLAVAVVERLVELEVVLSPWIKADWSGRRSRRAQRRDDVGEAVVLARLEVLLVVEVRVRLPDHDHAAEMLLRRDRVGLVERVDVGVLPAEVLRRLAVPTRPVVSSAAQKNADGQEIADSLLYGCCGN
jgi:hypothetical protein